MVTKDGAKTLKQMNSAKHGINMVIDKENSPKGGYLFGETQSNVRIRTYNGKEISKDLADTKIVLYEKNIQLAISTGKVNIEGREFDLKALTVDDYLGVAAVHEGIHGTDKTSSSATNPNGTRDEREKKPYEVQIKALEDLQKLRNP